MPAAASQARPEDRSSAQLHRLVSRGEPLVSHFPSRRVPFVRLLQIRRLLSRLSQGGRHTGRPEQAESKSRSLSSQRWTVLIPPVRAPPPLQSNALPFPPSSSPVAS